MVGLALACGCRAAPRPEATRSGPANDRLPTLKLQYVSADIEASPLYITAGFRIGPQGFIVSQNDAGDGMLFSIIDSSGALVRRFGRIGDGPGEVRGGGLTDISDSAIIVSNDRQGRLDRFALDGHLLESARTAEKVITKSAVSAREVLGLVARKEADLPVVASVTNGTVRKLMPGADSFMTSSFPAGRMFANGSVMSVKMPVLGRWPEGFILADGWDYRLALYGWDGRLRRILRRELEQPPISEARLDRAMRAELPFASRRGKLNADDKRRLRVEIAALRRPYFPHNLSSLGLDGEGRIWVIGIDADSAFADLFNQNRFVGRIGLPCGGFDGAWSVNGTWLALACLPDDPGFDGDAVFKVFRIVD